MTRPVKNRTRVCRQCGAGFEFAPHSKAVNCFDCQPNRAAYDRIKLYGVDQVMFDAMYFEQDGACAVCREAEATDLDHSHETGAPRALLCHPCNKGLGWFRDSALLMKAAAAYIEEHSV